MLFAPVSCEERITTIAFSPDEKKVAVEGEKHLGPRICRTFRWEVATRVPSERSNHHPWKTRKKRRSRNKTIVYSIPEGTELLTVEGLADVLWTRSVRKKPCAISNNHGEKDEKEEYL